MEECYFSYSYMYQHATLLKRITPPWVFVTFFKLCKWNQILQSVSRVSSGPLKILKALKSPEIIYMALITLEIYKN